MITKELQCIQEADEFRIKCVREQLEITRYDKSPLLDNWVMPLELEWKPSFGGKLLQVTLVPFAYLLIIPVCIAAQWLVEVSERIMLRTTLWKIIYRSKHGAVEPPLPENKTLWCLWQGHGIERRRFGEEHATELLDHWIVILYGKKTADRLDIEGRRKELWRIQTKVNMVYFEGKGTTFISYKNPFDSVLGEVAEDLPPYV